MFAKALGMHAGMAWLVMLFLLQGRQHHRRRDFRQVLPLDLLGR
jgi:hypothetical protein